MKKGASSGLLEALPSGKEMTVVFTNTSCWVKKSVEPLSAGERLRHVGRVFQSKKEDEKPKEDAMRQASSPTSCQLGKARQGAAVGSRVAGVDCRRRSPRAPVFFSPTDPL